MRSGAQHDVLAPNFKHLKRYINKENERKKRIAKIRESFERTKTVAEPSNSELTDRRGAGSVQ